MNLVQLLPLWLSAKDRSPHTERQYRLEILRFHEWAIAENNGVSNITGGDVEKYLGSLKSPARQDGADGYRRIKALSARSCEQSRRILHAFFAWATKYRYTEENPFWTIELDSKLDADWQAASSERVLSKGMKRLLCGNVGSIKQVDELRAATIAHLAFWAGASRCEIAQLTAGDYVQSASGAHVRLPGKNGEIVNLPIPQWSSTIIKRYLSYRSQVVASKLDKTSPLVASLTGNAPISAWSVRHALRLWQESNCSQRKTSNVLSPRHLQQAFRAIAISQKISEGTLAEHLRLSQVPCIRRTLTLKSTSRLYGDILKAIT